MFESFDTVWKLFIASLASAAITLAPTVTPTLTPTQIPTAIPTQQTQQTQTDTIRAVNEVSAATSKNWSGYASTNGSFTSVSGTWTIPLVSESGHTSSDATWVGIGGIKSTDIIQAGTQNIISSSGQIISSPFYEMLPDNAVAVTSLQIKPGDSITVNIIQQSHTNQWQISIRNNTTSQMYIATVTYSSSLSSAEWIEEAPSNGTNILPLDNFSSLQLTGGSATQNNVSTTISGSGSFEITMVNSSDQVISIPSTLGSDGASFSVSRSNATSTAPNPQFDQNPSGWRRRGTGVGQYTRTSQARRVRY